MCAVRPEGALVVEVAVQLSVSGSYLPPVFKRLKPSNPLQTIISLPLHTARVTNSGRGRVGSAGGCPTVGAGIVSAAGVQQAGDISAPDDHFTATPHCCVTNSDRGGVGGAGGCPTVGAGIVFAAGVKSG